MTRTACRRQLAGLAALAFVGFVVVLTQHGRSLAVALVVWVPVLVLFVRCLAHSAGLARPSSTVAPPSPRAAAAAHDLALDPIPPAHAPDVPATGWTLDQLRNAYQGGPTP